MYHLSTIPRCAHSEKFKYCLGKISAHVKEWTSLHKMKAIVSMPHSLPEKSNNLDAGNSTGNLLLVY